jgi:hypothetical protein
VPSLRLAAISQVTTPITRPVTYGKRWRSAYWTFHPRLLHQSSRLNSPGNFAALMAMRRASFAVNTLACIASASLALA